MYYRTGGGDGIPGNGSYNRQRDSQKRLSLEQHFFKKQIFDNDCARMRDPGIIIRDTENNLKNGQKWWKYHVRSNLEMDLPLWEGA